MTAALFRKRNALPSQTTTRGLLTRRRTTVPEHIPVGSLLPSDYCNLTHPYAFRQKP